MTSQKYSVGGVEITVETYDDFSFRLKRKGCASRLFKPDEIGFLQSDGVTFFCGSNEETGLLPGVPYIGLPTTMA